MYMYNILTSASDPSFAASTNTLRREAISGPVMGCPSNNNNNNNNFGHHSLAISDWRLSFSDWRPSFSDWRPSFSDWWPSFPSHL